MLSKIFVLILLNYINIHSSFHGKSNQINYINQDSLLPQRCAREYHLYGIRDRNGSIVPTTIYVIDQKHSINPLDIQEEDFFHENLRRMSVKQITLNDEDPIDNYLKSQEIKRHKHCCFLSCILRCLGLNT